jgi:hypothetical protein
MPLLFLDFFVCVIATLLSVPKPAYITTFVVCSSIATGRLLFGASVGLIACTARGEVTQICRLQ